MPQYSIKVNGQNKVVDVDEDTPLLWVLRDNLGLTGTKYSCGEGYCGCCSVHIDGEAERSCSVTIKEVDGKAITTIEGLAENKNHPIFKVWIDLEVSQCGYCQPGQIMTLAAMLNKDAKPSQKEINDTMSGILCRCGSYYRIRKAINKIVKEI
jgi:isoquinoline 1-oxidoreductase subunit alpha